MAENSTMIADREPRAAAATIPRRDLMGLATVALGGLIAGIVAIPGVAYLLSPLRRRGTVGAFQSLTRLSQLEVCVPRLFAVVDGRKDAWVKYPPEPVGSVWLVRQRAGSDPPVLAFQSECPHLGCAIDFKADRGGFVCPCHTSAFALDGTPANRIPPRAMDRLELERSSGEDPEIRVRFQRFRAQSEGRIPLA